MTCQGKKHREAPTGSIMLVLLVLLLSLSCSPAKVLAAVIVIDAILILEDTPCVYAGGGLSSATVVLHVIPGLDDLSNTKFKLDIPSGWTIGGDSPCTPDIDGDYACLGDLAKSSPDVSNPDAALIRLVNSAFTGPSISLTALTVRSFRADGFTENSTATYSFLAGDPVDILACPCESIPKVVGACDDCSNRNNRITGKAILARGKTGQTISNVDTTTECCGLCKTSATCNFFQYNYEKYECLLLATTDIYRHCQAITDSDALWFDATENIRVGGICGTDSGVYGDPHFVGGLGTKYDFNGIPGQTFCLLTDKELHINMGIEGYYGAPGVKVAEAGEAELHTWAKSLSVFWLRDGQQHVLSLRVRDGLNVSRAFGPFLAEATLDGAPLEPFEMNGQHVRAAPDAGVAFTFEGEGKYGNWQVTEKYSVKVQDHVALKFVLRPALPQLWSLTDAYIHFDLTLTQLEISEDVHGVLGQTYRTDRDERTEFYQKLAKQINGRMQVDGPHMSAGGFLDGALGDYKTSNMLDSACHMSRFNGHVPITVPNWLPPPADELLVESGAAVGQ